MTPERPSDPPHPGPYIKEHVLPPSLSIKAASELLGVGRPALSNLLNGKASLSSEMALRLEKTFGADSTDLLQRQALFDHAQRRMREPHVAARTYVPAFLTITAREIEGWVHRNLQARALLAVFLRKLVNSTGHNLIRVDFPGYDQAERKGWDGWVEAATATPWIPVGKSGWEFGCNEDPKEKADHDFAAARIKAISPAERLETAFVFATPRRWDGKEKWRREKEALGDWKSVVVYDASDLEQWLEQSIATQGWFAEQLGQAEIGADSLDEHWRKWSYATEPPLSEQIFRRSVQSYTGIIANWLRNAPDRPLILSADSKDEALAFLFCAFNAGELAQSGYKDRVITFSSAQTLRKVLSTTSNLIAVVHTEEVERELSGTYRHLHTIVIRPRNSVEATPDIALELLNYDSFSKALTAMGIEDHHRIDDLARESGYSPTILRRRLSKIPAIKTPPWSKNHEAIKGLIPMMLVGAWHVQSKADCEILSFLAGTAYDEVERQITALLRFDDPPVWSVGKYRGVASKIDAFFAVHAAVTRRDLDDLLFAAGIVLSETDPALELPEHKRIFAGLHGKTREHSSALRGGICETLLLLAVHGNTLFAGRLGINLEHSVNALIRSLLTPLSPEKLLSQNDDLPRYAEAAPDEFLNIIEEDLRTTEPQLYALMKPAASGIFWGGCPRTGLLWALEILAWKPERLLRVSEIFAQLAEHKIEDNWINKPVNSLLAIYRAWLPQTAASLDDRTSALQALVRRFPSVAWQVCLDQYAPGHQVGHYSERPRWRSDAAGAGHGVTDRERYEFVRKALDLALAWPNHDEQTLGDLVANLQGVPPDEEWRVWDLIESWAKQTADDERKAILRERIRRCAFKNRDNKQPTTTSEAKDRAREIYALLTPQDPVACHEWLFREHWVQESSDEIEDEHFDVQGREDRVRNERIAALQQIWSEQGFNGLQALIRKSGAESTIGWHMAEAVIDASEAASLLRMCLTLDDSPVAPAKMDELVRGFLSQTDPARREQITGDLLKELPVSGGCRLLKCSPFRGDTWVHVDAQKPEVRAQYWRDVYPGWLRQDFPDINEAVDRLLAAGRPRAAFFAVHLVLKQVETTRLKRLLRELATTTSEAADTNLIREHELSSALNVIEKRPGVTRDDMAQLEFLFISVLEHSRRGIPNLAYEVSESPALFVHALALAFKRRDNDQDPPEWCINNQKQKVAAAQAAYSLLEKSKRVPGTDNTGVIEAERLRGWLTEARSLCEKYGRAEVGDQRIGQLLAGCPPGSDGIWPCEAVRETLEEVRSKHIAEGMAIGVYNSRGVHACAPGGNQERTLAQKYRNWSRRLVFAYPYVANFVEQIARRYDDEAGWHDAQDAIQRRLPE
jgi:addiction module HigA family antidote